MNHQDVIKKLSNKTNIFFINVLLILTHPSFISPSFFFNHPPKKPETKTVETCGKPHKTPPNLKSILPLFFFFEKKSWISACQNKKNPIWFCGTFYRTATRFPKKTATTWHGKITRRTALQVVNFFKAHKISTAVAAHFTNAGCTTGWKVVVAGVVGLVTFWEKKNKIGRAGNSDRLNGKSVKTNQKMNLLQIGFWFEGRVW